ncbi:hypothetical protein NBRC116592_19140 [Colwellia sp. KU-HH00111]|uniref:2-dehydropantoate 2-reductase n=1 Tax=Colwellia sp. KU-HH00111 TaxID=3127652 RepID=UPI00310344AF
MKAQHHLIFFIIILTSAILLFFSSELLLPDTLKKLVFRSPQIDTIGHFIGFFILTWVIASLLKMSLMVTFFTLSLYAALSELGQYYLGFRNGELSDFFADIAGITLYLLLKFSYLKYKIFILKKIILTKQAAKVKPINTIIVGQGAMGLLWYHHIQQVIASDRQYRNNQLHLLASNKAPSLEGKVSTEPYYFTDLQGVSQQNSVHYAQINTIQSADVVLLFVKSFQVSAALDSIAARLKPSAAIILAHNGMGTLTELPASITAKHNIYALLTTHGCLRTSPLTITHTGTGSTDIGLLSGVKDVGQQQSIIALLSASLPPANYHQDIKQKQWLKLAINCVINPLTALNDIENGQITHKQYTQLIQALLKEVVAVAAAEGVNLIPCELTQTVVNVAQATASNSSSMRCDVHAKRQTEIDYINGYIAKLGIQHNIATPENDKLWKKVKNLA